jgi:hypothetical protein
MKSLIRFLLLCLLSPAVVAMGGALVEAEVHAEAMKAWHASDHRTAIGLWTQLAGAGDSQASLFLGYVFRQGLGVERDESLAADWYRQAAEGGEAEAQYELALMYELGIGVPRNPDQAAAWYGLATSESCPAELSAGGLLGDR